MTTDQIDRLFEFDEDAPWERVERKYPGGHYQFNEYYFRGSRDGHAELSQKLKPLFQEMVEALEYVKRGAEIANVNGGQVSKWNQIHIEKIDKALSRIEELAKDGGK